MVITNLHRAKIVTNTVEDPTTTSKSIFHNLLVTGFYSRSIKHSFFLLFLWWFTEICQSTGKPLSMSVCVFVLAVLLPWHRWCCIGFL